MASPAHLIQTVSDATGLPLATIVDMDRRLVANGLRTKGGRGLNAAQMTPLDAARLLTAVLASPQANASAEAVERYALTRIDKSRSSDGLFAATELDLLNRLPTRHGFVDMLAALIAAMPTLPDDEIRPIEIYAFTHATRSRVRFSCLPSRATVVVEYAPALNGQGAIRRSSIEAIGDLEQSRRITDRTLHAIALTLGTGGQHE